MPLKTGTALFPHLDSNRMEIWQPIPRCGSSVGPLGIVGSQVAPNLLHGYGRGSAEKNDVGYFVIFSTYFNYLKYVQDKIPVKLIYKNPETL